MAGETPGGENDVLALQALRDSIPPDAPREASQQLAWDMLPVVVATGESPDVTGETDCIECIDQTSPVQATAPDGCPEI